MAVDKRLSAHESPRPPFVSAARAHETLRKHDLPDRPRMLRGCMTDMPNAKKTRRDCSRRVPTFELAGPGAESALLPSFSSLAGDPSEVTALGVRHWITSFRC